MVDELNNDGGSAGANSTLNHDWEVIGRNLSSAEVVRTGKDCKAHVKLMEQAEPVLEGEITKDEVDFMSVRVRAWGQEGKTRWNALGREMRRDPKALQEKWVNKKFSAGSNASSSSSSGAAHVSAASGATSKPYLFKTSTEDGHSSDEEYDPKAVGDVILGGGARTTGGKKMDFSHAHRIEHSLSRFSWSPATVSGMMFVSWSCFYLFL